MVIRKFEDIKSWQKARELVDICFLTFKGIKDFSFKDQIFRASLSIMNNIAEGYERRGDKEFKHFLYIAKGSCAEVRSMLYVAIDRKYIAKDEFDQMHNITLEILRLLYSLIKTLD